MDEFTCRICGTILDVDEQMRAMITGVFLCDMCDEGGDETNDDDEVFEV